MGKRAAVVVMVLGLSGLMGFVAPAQASEDIVETGITEKVECFFRVYIQEGGESGLDCLT